MKCFRLFSVLSILGLLLAGNGLASILTTKHNLSVSGTGSVTATAENRVCIFCHTPHHAAEDLAADSMPLWSRKNSNAIYDLYASNTLVSQPGQPTGGSRLCLSCHDGTIAIGMLDGLTEPIAMIGGITTMPAGSTNLETDLSDDHPISFAYTSAVATQRGELHDPSFLPGEIKLEAGNMMQCTSCHDPHEDAYGMFLVMNNAGSALCLSCHDKAGWPLSSHALDANVAVEACGNCHQSHGAPGATHLLKNSVEEANCLATCHNGVGPGVNIQTDSNKFYNHPVNLTTGVHEVGENPAGMLEHVECADCHNPHQVNNANAPLANPPLISGRLAGVQGVTEAGTVLPEVSREYEICFTCHADNAFVGSNQVPRMLTTAREQDRFSTLNPSYHPVLGVGKNLNVPSLRPEYTEASQIYCTDCHGSDSSTKAGGVGANGPHGSLYPHILLDRYEQDTYPIAYSMDNYALCFRCHDPDVLFNPNITTFSNGHRLHVQTQQTPCSACHDPHGVPAVLGATTAANAHLINFDKRFVDPLTASYDSIAKNCTVSCHQQNPRDY